MIEAGLSRGHNTCGKGGEASGWDWAEVDENRAGAWC